MTAPFVPDRPRPVVGETARRRWRLAALLGLVVLLLLAGYSVIQTEQQAQAGHVTSVMKATADIRAGSVITDAVLGVARLRVDDPAVVTTLVDARDRQQLVGEVATDSVRAGSLIPAGLGVPRSTVTDWDVPLPVKRMPADLQAGDHVALVVDATARSGGPVEFVALQDVRVLGVHASAVDVWLPATSAAQVQWYADHGGGISLARMQPGAVQQDLRVGGAS